LQKLGVDGFEFLGCCHGVLAVVLPVLKEFVIHIGLQYRGQRWVRFNWQLVYCTATNIAMQQIKFLRSVAKRAAFDNILNRQPARRVPGIMGSMSASDLLPLRALFLAGSSGPDPL
jgi:hypothetical protein